ncbi:hypothetical protein HanXRQr2_Chr01g0027331 [Helianthus annuus]|uniref:Uncharacterized protein n=1 Tax=Helianthus annuus TaxID=4232 RepID=A0A251VQE2_HELAN|nr:uncharacterized protein LOC110873469 [Helianthus annuus]KAF5822506.1 hypothetical protein HanXRQr2_Chr01g0027331 [Helianthus annuus]KAJ0611965.1 hypothetical protein HanHA300_Chr01g0021831 [Helianthus annuus]KAJ0627334.1 hypothetical protein HanHA89_Chr01g0024151 [Helianthus annuus]
MASLTPGVLSKLLQTLDNPTAKVAGDHRSPLLQVIGIVPRDDVFANNKRFYLKLSDSLHSAYVTVPDADVDLILNDKIHLGQFVHVTRFESGSPVPIVRGIKPVPRRRACVGEPEDLISSEVLVIRGTGRVEFGKKKKKKESDCRRLSLSNVKVRDEVEGGRRLSLDFPARKGWDRSPAPAVKNRRSGLEGNGGSGTKVTEPSSPLCSTPVRSVRKSSLVKDHVLKPPNLNLAPLKTKNVIVSEKSINSKPIKKDLKASFDSIPVPTNLTKLPINSRSSSPDSKISWELVSPTIRQLGKEAICHRNLGFSTAVHALKESSAMENILQCMSRFAEICELAETSIKPLVEQFLNFYLSLQTSATAVNTLIDSKSTADKTKGQPSRNSALWVQAALETNLGKFTLLTMDDNRKIQDSEGNYHIVLENASDKIQVENRSPGTKKIPRTQEPAFSRVRRGSPSPSPTAKNKSPERVKWSKGSGLTQTAKLAEQLLLVSRKWFLNYLEESLNNGFWLTKGEDSGAGVGLLGQLKRVNQWLDDSVQGDENVESLRKKIYEFLLDHVQKAAR